MSLTDDVQKVKEILEKQEEEKKLMEASSTKKEKKGLFRLKGKVKSKAKKELKAGKILALILKKNKRAEFKWIETFGGIVQYDKYGFSEYDMSAVYTFDKYPLIVIPEWRLSPVGGKIERAEQEGDIKIDTRLFGGTSDILISDALNIGDAAQQTVIRAIEKKEADMNTKKKMSFGWLLWVGIGLVAVYIIGKLIGWF